MNAQQMVDFMKAAYGNDGEPGECNCPSAEQLPAGEWEPVPGDWCPMTFSAANGVPDELGVEPFPKVLERNGVLFVVTDDGWVSGHFRFRRV